MFPLRSNNRVKYLHGSFIRKICASNSRSFQWLTLYELDSIKISSGFQAAIIVQGSSAAQALVPAPWWLVLLLMAAERAQGLWPCSATKHPNPADLPGVTVLCLLGKPPRWWRMGPSEPRTWGRGPQDPGWPLPLRWHGTAKTSSEWPGQASGSTEGGLKGPSSSRVPNLSELQVIWPGKLCYWTRPWIFHAEKSPAQQALPLT